jgi:hypothetical protein
MSLQAEKKGTSESPQINIAQNFREIPGLEPETIYGVGS